MSNEVFEEDSQGQGKHLGFASSGRACGNIVKNTSFHCGFGLVHSLRPPRIYTSLLLLRIHHNFNLSSREQHRPSLLLPFHCLTRRLMTPLQEHRRQKQILLDEHVAGSLGGEEQEMKHIHLLLLVELLTDNLRLMWQKIMNP